jgi:hypothetical protein
MHPIRAVALNRDHLPAQINITTRPATASVCLGNNLSAQHAGSQVVSGRTVLDFLQSQAITVIAVADVPVTVVNGAGLLSGGVIVDDSP